METKEKRKSSRRRNPLMSLIYVAAGGAIGVMMAIYTARCEAEFTTMYPLTIMAFLIALLLTTVIHESGHLIGGLLTGYRFACFRVLGLSWSREQDGRIRMGMVRTPGIGGQCLMSPPSLQDGKMPFMLYHAGGSLMNLLAAVIFGVAAWIAGNYQPTAASSVLMEFSAVRIDQGRELARLLLSICAVANMAGALSNGIPMKTNLISNDGRNMLDLRASADALRRHWGDMNVAAGMWQGMRLKDMPDEWFAMPSDEELQTNPMFVQTGVMYYSRLIDQQRVEEACQVSDRLLADGVGINGLHRALLRMDRACIEMLIDTPLEFVRREKVDEWLDKPTIQVMKAMKKSLTVVRIEYARALLIEKDEQKAEKLREKFDKLLKKVPIVTDRESENGFMELVRETFERRKAQESAL